MKKHEFIPIVILIAVFAQVAMSAFAPTSHAQWPGPLENTAQRPKLLTFGLFVTPTSENNPITPPERFTGYHTALDIEIFEEETDKEVSVYAVCDGSVIFLNEAGGYGGVIVHSCQLSGEPVTILYGHVDPKSFTKKVGDSIKTGEKLGILGDEKSPESGFTRKHLHFGVHRGTKVELLGYVQNKKDLEDFIDPETIIAE